MSPTPTVFTIYHFHNIASVAHLSLTGVSTPLILPRHAMGLNGVTVSQDGPSLPSFKLDCLIKGAQIELRKSESGFVLFFVFFF